MLNLFKYIIRDKNKIKNLILSGTDRKNHDELPTLVGLMTYEALTSNTVVGG